jgi:mRNA deadenylase 3'-5' endonuclease subunit Ccr4
MSQSQVREKEAKPFTQRSFCRTEPNISKKDFSVVTYNTLCDAALLNSPAYEYCQDTFKKRNAVGSHRHELLIQEVS